MVSRVLPCVVRRRQVLVVALNGLVFRAKVKISAGGGAITASLTRVINIHQAARVFCGPHGEHMFSIRLQRPLISVSVPHPSCAVEVEAGPPPDPQGRRNNGRNRGNGWWGMGDDPWVLGDDEIVTPLEDNDLAGELVDLVAGHAQISVPCGNCVGLVYTGPCLCEWNRVRSQCYCVRSQWYYVRSQWYCVRSEWHHVTQILR